MSWEWGPATRLMAISAIRPLRITTLACGKGDERSGEISVTSSITIPSSTTLWSDFWAGEATQRLHDRARLANSRMLRVRVLLRRFIQLLRLPDRSNRNAKQIALVPRVHYDLQMPSSTILCDGCGQAATADHIARRLKRLEKMTRYRPIHVQTLLVGAVSPENDGDDLYSAEGEFRGEGADFLRALGIIQGGRSVE